MTPTLGSTLQRAYEIGSMNLGHFGGTTAGTKSGSCLGAIPPLLATPSSHQRTSLRSVP